MPWKGGSLPQIQGEANSSWTESALILWGVELVIGKYQTRVALPWEWALQEMDRTWDRGRRFYIISSSFRCKVSRDKSTSLGMEYNNEHELIIRSSFCILWSFYHWRCCRRWDDYQGEHVLWTSLSRFSDIKWDFNMSRGGGSGSGRKHNLSFTETVKFKDNTKSVPSFPFHLTTFKTTLRNITSADELIFSGDAPVEEYSSETKKKLSTGSNDYVVSLLQRMYETSCQ